MREENQTPFDRTALDAGWKFYLYGHAETPDALIYDVRPPLDQKIDIREADAKPTEAVNIESSDTVLKKWILPTANPFIKDPALRHLRPQGNPGKDFPFTKADFNDSSWADVTLPHDWAIAGPFQAGPDPEVGGGMGRLPVNGVAWYRTKIKLDKADAHSSVFLDFDGAMSYAMVWVNGHLAGGWPYGYNSFRIDIRPYAVFGADNQIAVRIDNPNHSARWYPGAGLYRKVYLVKANPIHLAQWGITFTSEVKDGSATIVQTVTVDNDSAEKTNVEITTELFGPYLFGSAPSNAPVPGQAAVFPKAALPVAGRASETVTASVTLQNPELWGPPPTQRPNLYRAVTTLFVNGRAVDCRETEFGIREVDFLPDSGLHVNGEQIRIRGVNLHHDLGALGAAFNKRAAERQLELLRETGCNAIRFSHNPPASEFLELTDRMGFLVINEIFDCWERKKTPHDFHLIFKDWSEADARAFVRRDRNHPSIILWSFGNEVGEQYTDEEGAKVGERLRNFVREEDPTRPTVCAMNYALPHMALPRVPDVIGLNYQGEGIRQAAEFESTDRIRTPPMYAAFHERFPNKVVLSTETASAFSSRGVYHFPVTPDESSPVRDGRGGDSTTCQVSSYELYAVDFGSSADKVFRTIDNHPFVAGEFVWTGWDHLGEPTPYYDARSSYCGIFDLAGFKKNRFYLYQAHWRPDFPMAKIFPHWSWEGREGLITPVHVATSGDAAELFLNGRSLGLKRRQPNEYRLRWDDLAYEKGELRAIAYKNGAPWAEDRVRTAGAASALRVHADRPVLRADGSDLAFLTVTILDESGECVPNADNRISFTVEGCGTLVATDNGDPTNMESFASPSRAAFNGLCLGIIRTRKDKIGEISVRVTSPQCKGDTITIQSGG